MKPLNSLFLSLCFSTFILLIIGCNPITDAKKNSFTKTRDSISVYLSSYKRDTKNSLKKKHLEQAYKLNKKIDEDSLKIKNLLEITDGFYRVGADSFFRQSNYELHELSFKIKDSNALAESYWNYANFHDKKVVYDSAYYYYNKAFVLYNAINNEYYTGRMLLSMAYIEKRLKNYTGSEVLTFRAISKFKPLKRYFFLYECYNRLGLIYHNLKEHDKAVYYFEEALGYLKKVKKSNKGNRDNLYNNLGLVYHDQGDYKKAISHFNAALKHADPKNKKEIARVITNLAFSKMLNGDNKNVLNELKRALSIRDSIKDKVGIIASKLRIADYYVKFKDTLKAITYAKDVKNLSKTTKVYADLLEAYMLLSNIDKNNSEKHLKDYISLKERFEIEERKTRDKFTRIRFETNEYVEETKRLSQQKFWISGGAIVLILILSLLFFIKQQRAKNKELQFEAEQQKYNEEIYELILKQQAILEEGRLQERHRISEELHDGVLSKLFGTRMGMGFLSLKGDAATMEKHDSYVNELQGIEKEIRVISHELKNEVVSSKFSYLKIIESFVEEQSKIAGYHFELKSDKTIAWEEVDEKIKMNFYRIIQEGIQNIGKHANATNVRLNFKIIGGTLELSIKDNGKGFDINKNRKGIGLSNINSRMKKIGGLTFLDSHMNKGTTITASVSI